MLFKLFMKECSQTVKSLTYWLMVIIMVLFFASQMGQMDMEKAPEKGLEDYGVKPSKDKNIIMSATLPPGQCLSHRKASLTGGLKRSCCK